jgi:outer membrane protein assembly factor BamB
MFYILNGNSGYPLCSKTIQTYIFDAVTVGYGEVFAGDDSHLLALRDYSLEVDWCTGTYGAVSTPAIGYGLVYTCSDEARYVWEGGYVQAFDVYTGEKRWEYRTGGDRPFISDSAAIADGKVFVGGYDDNKIHALNALTGSLLWTYETGDRIESTPAVADGKLFVGSSDGNVYAFAYGEPPVHDIGVTKFAKDPLNKNVVCQNYTAHFNVTLENQGDFDELVNVSLYRNATKISTTTVSVGNMSTVAVRMVWNTSGVARYKTYNISVYAELVPGETDVSDNSASAGTAVVSYSGDVNADRRVDLKDVFAVNKAFGSRPGSANWKPNCDITDDKFVDLRDKFIVDSNYGYVEPP